jgi:uncharacterized DUF497 family protein
VVAPDFERGEQRYVAAGMSARGRVLYVVSVEVENDVLRIVAARKATAHERRRYEEDE